MVKRRWILRRFDGTYWRLGSDGTGDYTKDINLARTYDSRPIPFKDEEVVPVSVTIRPLRGKRGEK